MKQIKRQCQQCGTCCIKGGPALHKEDIDLVKSGKILVENLITIRQGELVYKPQGKEPEAALCELIKISGVGREWQCRFFAPVTKSCTIYDDRPLSCRKLECWNTEAVEQLVEKDTLDRFDIVDAEQPIYPLMKEHEQECKCPDPLSVLQAIQRKDATELDNYEQLVNRDIRYRTAAVDKLDITLAEELFYFGRPLFQVFQQMGFGIGEKEGQLKLNWPKNSGF